MGERTIKVAFTKTIRMVTIPTMLSFLVSLILWTHISFTQPYSFISIGISSILLVLLFQIRFMSHMTVSLWSNMWGTIAPLLAGSIFTLHTLPTLPLLSILFVFTLCLGIWLAYRLYPLLTNKRLHKSRFAR